MDAQAFWNVIGNYNQQTKNVQIILFMILGIALSYTQTVKWSAKFVLGIAIQRRKITVAPLRGRGLK